jgi:very-short-patch-repair endonuclease
MIIIPPDSYRDGSLLVEICIRSKTASGYQFRRQGSILKYIADFVCLERMLVIEVDGLTHQWDETTVKDKMKQTDS